MSITIPALIWAAMQAEADAFESFAEQDWTHDPGPRSQNRWKNVKSGKIIYSATNPGGTRGDAAQPPEGIGTAFSKALDGQAAKPEEVTKPKEGIGSAFHQALEKPRPQAAPRSLVQRKTPEEREQLFQAARAKVKDVLAGERTPEAAHELIGALSELTVKQLHDIKKEYGLKASGPRKEELKKKIAARMAGATTPADQIKRTPAPKPEPWKGTSEPDIGQVYNAPTSDLQVDPERFQFKLNTNKEGVTQELKSVTKWNPDFAGVLAVWKDPANGKSYVVNGHHRRELAGRLGVDNLAVRYIDAKTPEEARAMGALINMAEGRGTPIDAAKFMRDAKAGPEQLQKAGVSLKGKLIDDAMPLTKLNDRIFDRVARGSFDPEKAKAIGKHLDNPDLQNKLVSLLDKREEDGKDLSPKVVEEMAREMASTPTHTVHETGGLFGDIESEESLFVERNELKSHVRQALSKDVRDFQAVASQRRAGRVAEAGNVLNVEKNKQIAQESDQQKNVFDSLVNRKGAVSDAVNEAAKKFADAKGKKAKDAAKAAAVESVRAAIKAEGDATTVGGPAGGLLGKSPAGDNPKPATSGAQAADGGGASAGGNDVTPERVAYADKLRKAISNGKIFDAPDSLGIPRDKMPQIPGPHHQEFMDSLKAKGIGITKEKVPAASLKASQKELNPEQIAAIPPEKRNLPVVVSNDGYLLDGHHRWAANVSADPNSSIDTIKVDMPIRDLIKEAEGFDKVWHKSADQTGPPPGVAPSKASTSPEMTKEQAKEVMKSIPAPDKLPEGHHQYFNVDKADKTVPMDKIVNLRGRPEGIANAGKFMEGARLGKLPKRDPVKVVENPDGTFTVADGNSTFANAKQSGWKDLPVKLVGRDFLEHEQDKTLAKEHTNAKESVANHKHFTPDEMSIPRTGVISAQSSKEEVFKAAQEKKPEFDNILDHGQGVQKALGADAVSPKNQEDFDAAMKKPGAVVMMAPIKSEKRSTEKVNADYGGNWNELHDTVRGTVAVDTMSDVPKAISAIRAEMEMKGWKLAKAPKNRFGTPTMEGYSDIMLNARAPNGLVTELQVHVKPMVAAKEKAHGLYEQELTIFAKMKLENRGATEEEKGQIKELIQKQRDVYGTAYLESLGLHNSGGPVDARQLGKLKEMWQNEHGERWDKELSALLAPPRGKDDAIEQDHALRVQESAGPNRGGAAAGGSESGGGVGRSVGRIGLPATRVPGDGGGVREGVGGSEVDAAHDALKNLYDSATTATDIHGDVAKAKAEISKLSFAKLKQVASKFGVNDISGTKEQLLNRLGDKVTSRREASQRAGAAESASEKAPWHMTKDEFDKSGIQQFSTDQGSQYIVHPKTGQTFRIKSPHKYHDPKDAGLKSGSVETHFTDKDGAQKIGMWQTSSADGKRLFVNKKEGYIHLTSLNPKTGQRGSDGKVPLVSSTPKMGLHPVELTNPSSLGEGWYSGSHPGSAVSGINDNPNIHGQIVDAARASGKKGFGEESKTPTHAHVKQAKADIAAGRLAVKGNATSEPIKSDLSGDTIRRHVMLPNGARVHPDELHRVREGEGGKAELGSEQIAVRDPMNKGEDKHPSFAKAVHAVAAYPIRHNDRVTIQGPHGYSATKTRKEWRDVHAKLKDKPESMAQWMDRENPETTSETAKNAPASGGMASEKETKSFFTGGQPDQGKLFDYKTPAQK